MVSRSNYARGEHNLGSVDQPSSFGITLSPTYVSDLIKKNRRSFENSEFNLCGTIFSELDEWRLKRNACVHSYCKFDEDSSFSENAVKDLEDTLLSTAREGRQLVDLARQLSEFAKKQYQDEGH